MRWNNISELVEALEENYPEEDLTTLSSREIFDLVSDLSDFEDDPENASDALLKSILLNWKELREGSI